MKNLTLSTVLIILLTACGGGGGESSSTPTPTQTSSVTGQFIDDPVQGLSYSCSSGTSGLTNSNGEYTCIIGDDVTFRIGSITIGTIAAQTTAITPYSLFPNDTQAAINVARLLQSLDTTSNDGIITLDTVLANNLPSTTDFTSPSFATEVESVLNITLVSEEDAKAAMDEAVLQVGGTIPQEGNSIPVANAGIDQNVKTTTTVTLDGSASYDPDIYLKSGKDTFTRYDQLTYAWTLTSKPVGSNATLTNATSVNPTFVADIDGSYVAQLVVNDGTVNSTADTVTINATTANSAPVANAGVDQNVEIGVEITLNGAGSSDADLDTLTYAWSIVSKPAESTATLTNTTAVNPTIALDKGGSYVIQLIVNDGTVDSVANTVTIDATRLVTNVSNTTELRAALNAAATNGVDDIIILADGTYKTTDDGKGTFRYLSNEDNSLALKGSASESVILSGDNTDQVFSHIVVDYYNLLKLENLSIVHGHLDMNDANKKGGGVYSEEKVELNNPNC